jgi:hypothetical protein
VEERCDVSHEQAVGGLLAQTGQHDGVQSQRGKKRPRSLGHLISVAFKPFQGSRLDHQSQEKRPVGVFLPPRSFHRVACQ